MSMRMLLVMPLLLVGGGSMAWSADVVSLRGGIELRGLIIDHRSDDQVVKLRTERGEIPLLRSGIDRIDRDADLEARYWLAREFLDETADGLLDLALWCQANELPEARDEHLNAVLEIDPDHIEARTLLGYVRRGREWVLEETREVETGSKSKSSATPVKSDVNRRERLEMLKQRQELLRRQAELSRTIVRLATLLESKSGTAVLQA